MANVPRVVIQTTLAAALAPAGTLVLAYPAGTNAGSFVNGLRHRVVTGSNDVFKAPKHFTVAYGATTFTLTWGAGVSTLPIGTKLFVQLDRPGESPQNTNEARFPSLNNTSDVALKLVSLSAPLTADADGVSASQSVAADASFTLNGALLSTISTGRMIFDVPRNIVAAWTGTAVLTATGKDDYGNTLVETSASGTSHTGKKAFKEITSVTSSASITSATVGTGVVLGLPVFLPTVGNILGEFRGGVAINGNKEPVYVQTVITEAEVDAATSKFVVAPVAGYIVGAQVVSESAVTTGGSITFKIATVAVTGLAVVVADSGGAGGVYDSDVPTSYVGATGLVAKGDMIEIVGDAAFNASSAMHVTIAIQPIFAPVGTVVPGKLDAVQSGTTGDVRGTYSPLIAPDGTTSHALLLALTDPDFLGDDQYAG
jgi:hypothetical protein